jgi:hypothetical protein
LLSIVVVDDDEDGESDGCSEWRRLEREKGLAEEEEE